MALPSQCPAVNTIGRRLLSTIAPGVRVGGTVPPPAVAVIVTRARNTAVVSCVSSCSMSGRGRLRGSSHQSVVSRHLRNIFEAGELGRDSVVAKNATTAADGKVYQVEYFNLDAIISVGYRINSTHATRFRQWATRVLRASTVSPSTN